MAYRMVCAPQVIDLESERGHPHVHSENLIRNGNDLSDQGGQYAVRVVRNATNVGLSDTQGYYNMSMNHPHQLVHNSAPNLGVDSGFVFPSSMYNHCVSTSMNRYVSHAQSFGLPLNEVVSGSMDESTRTENVGETARGYIKRKNAAAAGSCHFVNRFASSSSSSHASQNPTHRPWDPSVESNVFPNVLNPSEYHSHSTWPSMEGSSITGTSGLNSMAAHPESAQHGNYTFQSGHASQCFQPARNAWVSQAANGIAEGVPQWAYINTMTSVPAGRYAHSGATETVNGGFHEYQNGPSTISQGPLPYFHQHAAHSMQAYNPLDHTRMPIPYQQCHNNGVLHGGINHSGNRLHLGPRTPVLFSNSERSFGPPHHPFLVNPDNHRNVRIPPPLQQRGTIMDFSRLYEVPSVVDEHSDMRLDIDSMTYEELLALEEHIGDVNTGLVKSHIVDKLKTSLYVPGTSCMSDQPSESSTENEACIICQEEYRAADCIANLDCGHRYHAECIKQWLTVKNLCPICKTTALSAGRRSG